MSFTITAILRPWGLLSTWFRRVVLPAPRNPERTVTGRSLSTGRVPFAAGNPKHADLPTIQNVEKIGAIGEPVKVLHPARFQLKVGENRRMMQ
jgi:hypothetical protein